MAGRVQQDSFIDDAESCPLCVEELDLSDRNFRPCPCGYQVCQFCFNNIKNNLNGLCPACRRPYDDKTIEWKFVSPEEFKADLQKQARKKAEIRQKEAQKREAESLNRRHLAGLRVVQKNLVYVVGLNPRIREDDLLHTLRGSQYFGQYGKIIKIVVSRSKDVANKAQSLGVHVTFARQEDAEKCIAAVDGSENGGRVLRAQFGTTKYCAAYLRNETCANKNCMFLHEPGEEKDSFTRQDLSSINAASTQRPAQQTMPISSTGRHGPPEAAPARPSSGPPALRAAQTMTRDSSRDEASPIDPGDGSALPSSASWATRGIPHGSRRGSQAPSASTPSPRVEHATLGIRPATAHKMEALVQEDVTESPPSHRRDPQPSMASDPRSTRCLPRSAAIDDHPSMAIFDQVIRAATSPNLRFSFKKGPLLDELRQYPCLIDPNGGAKLASIQARESLRQREASSRKLAQTVGRAEAEMALESGSLQLGGEPEGAPGPAENGAGMDPPGLAHQGQRHQATIQQPTHHPLPTVATVDAGLGTTSYPAANPFSNLTFNSRTFAPSQSSQHHLLLKPANPPSANYLDQYLNHPSSAQLSHGESLRQAQQLAGPSQARQSSRYPTTSDAASSGPTAKSAINTRFMGPQPGIMQTGSVANQAQTLHALQQSQQLQHVRHQAFGGSIPLPPPGLKPASIAPSSTGGLSGHGLNMGGFSPNPTGNVGHPDDRTELLREMLRTRGTSAGIGGLGIGGVVGSGGHTAEAGKLDLSDPSIVHARMQQQPGSAGIGQSPYGEQGQGGFNPAGTMYGGGINRW